MMKRNDIIEKLPEAQPIKSYNEEYYNSLSEIKMINVPIEKEHRLFYEFEHNANASVSTSSGQILVQYSFNKYRQHTKRLLNVILI